jgi:hypothetical protein
MKNFIFKPKRGWPGPPELEVTSSFEGNGSGNRPAATRFFQSSLMKGAAIFFFGYLIYVTNYATWAMRLTLCMLFCSMIYTRDNSPSGRWVAIGIIAVGTLLSILLPLTGIGPNFLRSVF